MVKERILKHYFMAPDIKNLNEYVVIVNSEYEFIFVLSYLRIYGSNNMLDNSIHENAYREYANGGEYYIGKWCGSGYYDGGTTHGRVFTFVEFRELVGKIGKRRHEDRD